MTRIYSEAELDRMANTSKRIMDAMNDVPEYDLLCGIMSAHVQRMICDKALTGEDPYTLLETFHSACAAKIKWWTDIHKPKMGMA